MKKVVIVIIVALFFGSVVLINLFGLKFVPFEETVFVQSIECKSIRQTNTDKLIFGTVPKDAKNIDLIFKVTFVEGKEEYTKEPESLKNNPNTYYIDCAVVPANARNRNVNFIYDENNDYYVFNSEMRTITFLAKNVGATIKIIAADDRNGATKTIYISAK